VQPGFDHMTPRRGGLLWDRMPGGPCPRGLKARNRPCRRHVAKVSMKVRPPIHGSASEVSQEQRARTKSPGVRDFDPRRHGGAPPRRTARVPVTAAEDALLNPLFVKLLVRMLVSVRDLHGILRPPPSIEPPTASSLVMAAQAFEMMQQGAWAFTPGGPWSRVVSLSFLPGLVAEGPL
jgi:hypothetical protein